ncbi:MAG: methyl-accepting chemotaxis protein, partial [bacterium]|nr:methyl-accepting chemotaxis protein [bacterium]
MLKFSKLSFKITHRLAIGFALIVILLTASVTVTLWKVDTINTATHRIKVLRTPTAAASANLTKNIYASLAALRGWMLTGKEAFKTERAAVWEDIGVIRVAMDDLSTNWTNPGNIAVWSEFKTILDEFAVAQRQVERLANSANEQPATKMLIDEAAPHAVVMFNKITEMIDLELANHSGSDPVGNRVQFLGIMADVRG